MKWSVEQSRDLYNISGWSEGYIDIDKQGHLLVRPHRKSDGQAIDLVEVAAAVKHAGLNWPVLVRCGGILRDRIDQLCEAFQSAREQQAYSGAYTAVYPIKVNQQFSVVSELVEYGADRVGLEAGSKPELMAVLGLSPPGGVVICNGYKDREYVRLGLIGRHLGQRLYLVIEKLSELELIIEQSKAMGIKPLLGVRIRLASIGIGNWQNTGGEKSKFGLQAGQILKLVERLRDADMLDSLQLLHFHLGSQLANLDDINKGVVEASRFYAELCNLGVPLQVMDVGGGLGVDYEGTASRGFCSTNYSLQQYADTVVETVLAACNNAGLPHPELITESGRSMTAHHAFLITNVIDVEQAIVAERVEPPPDNSPGILSDLWHVHEETDTPAPETLFQRAQDCLVNVIKEYSKGVLDLSQRAWAESCYIAICRKVRDQLKEQLPEDGQLLDRLNEKLADKYFMNLSVFQSLPDVWAIDQIFPIVPLQRLDEKPGRRAILQDLTCDSDGHIEFYVDGAGVEKSLPVHATDNDTNYLLGIFMVGAYQEILGDMHNLFGDTDAVNLEINDDGSFRLEGAEHGDRADELLKIVHFDPGRLRAVYRQRTQQAELTVQQKRQYLAELEAGLAGYTYLED